jgi:hypothetical protein
MSFDFDTLEFLKNVLSEGEIEDEAEVEAGKDEGRYKLKGLWCWVTWAKSTYDHTRIGEFYEELKKRFPLDNQAKVYGCHELHVDGMSHYHVTLKFKKKFRSGCQ